MLTDLVNMSALSIQLSELEMLQSMFSPSELRLEPGLLDSIKSILASEQLAWPLVSFIINLDVEVINSCLVKFNISGFSTLAVTSELHFFYQSKFFQCQISSLALPLAVMKSTLKAYIVYGLI